MAASHRRLIFYVYVDWTLEESPRAFYVGKGQEERLKHLARNTYHSRISQKYGVKREILFSTWDESFAFEEEIRLIALHKTYFYENDFGANFTRGGEGSSGFVMDEESRKARSEKMTGVAKGPFTEDHRQALRDAKIGVKLSEEHKMNIKASMRTSSRVGHAIDDETRNRISDSLRGHVQSIETRAKRSESLKKAWARRKEKAECSSHSGEVE